MEKEEKHICCAILNFTAEDVMFHNWKVNQTCGNKAKYFENDKWYCKRHAPSEIEKKEAVKSKANDLWQLESEKKWSGLKLFEEFDKEQMSEINKNLNKIKEFIKTII